MERAAAHTNMSSEDFENTNGAQHENWFKTYWRPGMAWLYMAICAFDFLVAPIITLILPGLFPAFKLSVWKPLTLDGGGLIHFAFAAVLGITAWTRGHEKAMIINSTHAPPPQSPSYRRDEYRRDEPPRQDPSPAPSVPPESKFRRPTHRREDYEG